MTYTGAKQPSQILRNRKVLPKLSLKQIKNLQLSGHFVLSPISSKLSKSKLRWVRKVRLTNSALAFIKGHLRKRATLSIWNQPRFFMVSKGTRKYSNRCVVIPVENSRNRFLRGQSLASAKFFTRLSKYRSLRRVSARCFKVVRSGCPSMHSPNFLTYQTSLAYRSTQSMHLYLALKYKNWTQGPTLELTELLLRLTTLVGGVYPRFSLTTSQDTFSWLPKWLKFISLYGNFSLRPFTELYLYFHNRKKDLPEHYLYMTFTGHRFVVTLSNVADKKTHFFLTTGLLLRYAGNRKSLKKNKALKLLMARFLRKLLIVLGLKRLSIHVRGVPLHLEPFLAMLSNPLTHGFMNPLTGQTVDESRGYKATLPLHKIIFLKLKPYGYQKMKKTGRIKRKIRRKVVKLGNVID